MACTLGAAMFALGGALAAFSAASQLGHWAGAPRRWRSVRAFHLWTAVLDALTASACWGFALYIITLPGA